jgi:hypothetical protein
LHFALEAADGACAVWALNTDQLAEPIEAILNDELQGEDWEAWQADRDFTQYRTFNRVFVRHPAICFVGPVNSYRLNERLAVQQGLFVCTGDVSRPFEQNLARTLPADHAQALHRLNIQTDAAARRDILVRLSRMNISRTTLFPGLDGFAQSLNLIVEPQQMTPDDNWPGQ